MTDNVQLAPFQVPSHIREKLRVLGDRYGSQTKSIIVAIELLYEREVLQHPKADKE